MVTLHEGKQFIIDNERIATAEEAANLSEEEGRKETLTYQVLAAHNHSGNMKNLEIQFDSMGVYDNTYVGILQTAYASGLKEFPMPCVFTNCHNCLCAVGGTINTDVHKYAESACKKSGGIFVPPHEAVIHQYMREMIVKSGGMSIVSDSHTRYGTQGSISIGEGGPELAKAMLGKYYEIEYPGVIAVFLTGKPKPWVGPMDVALSIIGKVFKNNFVKNKILEFVGPGVSSMSMDFRNGIDTMTTESACLSSVWATDEQTKRYFEIHKRPDDFKEMKPGHAAMYDGIVEINLDTIVPMIALPFHPSNAYPLADVIADPEKYMTLTEKEAERVFENNKDIHLDLHSKIQNGKIKVDQAAIAECAAGSFENIFAVDQIAKKMNHGLGTFPFNIYPASQPIMYELNKIGVLNDLMNYGVRVKTAFCGPCFGASDAPGNNDFCIRHSTRNFPNREGSNPANGQIASVALMDSKSIAATAFNGGYLTSAEDCPVVYETPEYEFNEHIYDNIVYNGFGKAKPETEIVYGPSIKDWPKMPALTENLLRDSDTGALVDIDGGELYETQILGIEKGQTGKPGVMSGVIYYGKGTKLGDVTENTTEGIYGTVNRHFLDSLQADAIPIGFRQDIQRGRAYIRSKVSGEVKDYEIEIQKVDYGSVQKNKGLVLKVVDEDLLNLTGGIVQGMSGSPIIQDGKLIGAVTHVFINDPTRGYGIFMENMLGH